MYTQLVGRLNLAVQGEIEGIPLAIITLWSEDIGSEDELIFEYELPLNFNQESNLSDTFHAL